MILIKNNKKITINSIEVLYKLADLEEHTLYEVKVQSCAANPTHKAFLFFGFKSGGYGNVYTNNYGQPIKLERIYSIEIIKKLSKLK